LIGNIKKNLARTLTGDEVNTVRQAFPEAIFFKHSKPRWGQLPPTYYCRALPAGSSVKAEVLHISFFLAQSSHFVLLQQGEGTCLKRLLRQDSSEASAADVPVSFEMHAFTI